MTHIGPDYKPAQWAVERAERILQGRQTLYNAEIHIPLLFECLSTGGSISSFVTKANVSRQSFYEWVNVHPEFAEAYRDAKELCQHYMEEFGRNGICNPSFNATLYATIMRNKMGWTDQRKIKVKNLDKAKSHNEAVDLIKKGMAEGDYTSSEAKHLTSIIADCAVIDEKTKQVQEIEMLKQQVEGKK